MWWAGSGYYSRSGGIQCSLPVFMTTYLSAGSRCEQSSDSFPGFAVPGPGQVSFVPCDDFLHVRPPYYPVNATQHCRSSSLNNVPSPFLSWELVHPSWFSVILYAIIIIQRCAPHTHTHRHLIITTWLILLEYGSDNLIEDVWCGWRHGW
jgi:hypothetical protein